MKTYKENQIHVIECETFEEFQKQIGRLDMYDNLIFRGQRDSSWELKSSIDRLFENSPENILVSNRIEAITNKHLERFKNTCLKNNINIQSFNDDQCWALGQHYNLSTPLLDWTESPYIALFFAFHKSKSSKSGKRAVWILSKTTLKDKSKELTTIFRSNNDSFPIARDLIHETNRHPIVEVIEPNPEYNKRLIRQNGLFTRAPLLISIDKWVNLINVNSSPFEKSFLWKVTLPDEDREYILAILKQMNINYSTLFPDVFGASEQCNLIYELEMKYFEADRFAKMAFHNYSDSFFDNDSADAWLDSLIKTTDLSLVENTINDAKNQRYLEFESAYKVLAAIEVIARIKGNYPKKPFNDEYIDIFGNSNSAKVDSWLKSKKFIISKDIVVQCQEIIDQIKNISELSKKFANTKDYVKEKWLKQLDHLKSRII